VDVTSFAEIEKEFMARIARIVWCTVATVDRRGRPRTRILHPIWEGTTGWIATGRHSHKAKHLEQNPWISCSYWDQQHQQVYADCRAEWIDDLDERRRIWELYKSTPPPLGYDPAMIWRDPAGPASDDFGILKLTPWRIELYGLSDLATGAESLVWRPA
jgi:general stress protein 26